MWHITISGHMPENPARVLNFTIRGRHPQTLSTRVRAAAGWKHNAMRTTIDENTIEFHPSKRGNDVGYAKCEWIVGEVPKRMTTEEQTQVLLQNASSADLLTTIMIRFVDPVILMRAMNPQQVEQLLQNVPKDTLVAEVRRRVSAQKESA